MSPEPSPAATRPHDGAQRPNPPSQPFQIGLLGHGTVGSAFAKLLAERSEHVRRLTGRTPVLAGTLTRSQGDFAEILDGSELIVELLGGIEPARDYVLAALRAGRHVVSANKQLLSQHGEELFAAAQQHGVQLRFEAAVAGVVPVVRVLAESLAGAHIERIHGIVNGTTNYILSEMEHGCTYEEALAQAQRQGYAEADPSDDVSGRDAAAKMAILARLAFATPVHLDQVPYEGIEQLQADDLQYARELGLGLKLIGTAERRPLTGGEGKGGGAGGEGAGGEGAGGGEGLSVRVHPAFLYAGHPLASVRGPFNAVTVESPAITEITMSGPGAGGLQTASAVLGDVVSVMRPPPIAPVPLQPLPLVHDVASSFYLHMEVADRPGVLAEVARVLGDCGASIKSVVQRGLGENARLVVVIHPISQSRLQEAIARIAELDFLRSAPRAIRVIEEEFT
jgi:homoserine dehydrogenase